MTEDLAKAIGANYRDREKITSAVGRHLMKDFDSERRSDCIHPSEAASSHWCPRSTYYRISGVEPDIQPRWLAMEMVFETGNQAHTKWQTWTREMGILHGVWKCKVCNLRWWDTSPHVCPRCEFGADVIEYAEVPVESPFYLLAGQADGDVLWEAGSKLIEVKTIGTGTLRFEAPQLIEKYSYTHTDNDGKVHSGTDWLALWQGIRRPFPPHLRQGMIYCFCADRKEIVYIYDPKFVTAYPKEFEIQFNREIITDILDQCLVVKNALEKQRPPKRPIWAEKKEQTCKKCVFKKTCWNHDSGRDGQVVRAPTRSKNGAA